MSSRLFRLAVALFAAFALLAQGCAAVVGDACEAPSDCGQGMFCELSLPGGYCTIRDCTDRACPEEGLCVRFSADVSYCMARCESDGDCRDGYRCVEDFGPHGFCNDERGESPSEG